MLSKDFDKGRFAYPRWLWLGRLLVGVAGAKSSEETSMRPITAADLMNPEVLTVPEDMTVQELARYLTDNEITGAPVEDVNGKLIGVVSVVDIASVASDTGDVRTERSNPDFYVRGWEDQLTPEEMRDFRVDNEDLQVGEIMTPTIFSVGEDATVAEVASVMLRGHLHRLLVTRDERPIGIVSSSDLLGLLVEEAP
jgi:CBS domain-containing protein